MLLLYQSGALVGGGGSAHIEVSVEGVQTLRLVVDKNSSATHDHAAWGGARLLAKPMQKTTPDPTIPAPPNPFRYCGEYYDAETGNIYLRARYYNPSIGRFLSEDPIQDGWNWYVYGNNNPILFFDPTGLKGEPRYVNGTDVNLRSGAGINFKVLDILEKGTEVAWTGEKTGVINGHQWAQVEWNGITGWVAADYLGVNPVGVQTKLPPTIQMSSTREEAPFESTWLLSKTYLTPSQALFLAEQLEMHNESISSAAGLAGETGTPVGYTVALAAAVNVARFSNVISALRDNANNNYMSIITGTFGENFILSVERGEKYD